MSKKWVIGYITLSLGLSACTSDLKGLLADIKPSPAKPSTLATPAPGPTGAATRSTQVLAGAKSKREISLDQISNQGTAGGSGAARGAPAAVPAAAPMSDRAVAMPGVAMPEMAIAPKYFPAYYGGGDFNTFVATFAEENIYPGAQAGTLLQAYNGTIVPILKEWDTQARLLESRGNVGKTSGFDDGTEYIYLPGSSGSEPVKIKPDWIFRLASNALKETLNIYIMPAETRVHRVVWGEPHIDMAKVKIDSDRAIEIARQAFASQNANPGYPVYPQAQYLGPEAQIVYDLPQSLFWRLHLNQQGNSIRYFLSFSYQDPNQPVPQPVPMMDIATREKAVAAPTFATQLEGSGGQSVPGSTGIANPSTIAVPPSQPFYQPLYGSIVIDAATGKVYEMNRPVIYNYNVVKPLPEPMPMPVEPKPLPESTPAPDATPKPTPSP